MSANWLEVSKEAFFADIGPKKVHPQPVGLYPYSSLFKTPIGEVIGKIEGFMPGDSGLPEDRYFLRPAPTVTAGGEAT